MSHSLTIIDLEKNTHMCLKCLKTGHLDEFEDKCIGDSEDDDSDTPDKNSFGSLGILGIDLSNPTLDLET
jgi:hypothetical protein